MTSSERIAQAVRHVLPNGVTVLAQRNSAAPTVSVIGEVMIGAAHEPLAMNGLARFTGSMLVRGAGERSFQAIVAETEERGCSVFAGSGLHETSFGARALSEDLGLVLEILADMLIRPTFPEREIEKLRGQIITDLRQSEEDTGVQASRAVRGLLYPEGHPYARLSIGTPESIGAISRADLAAHHALFHPELARIAIVGDVEPSAAVDLVAQFFGGWHNPNPPQRVAIATPPPLTSAVRQHIELEGKLQTDLIWAVPGLRRSDPHYYPAVVGNLILGQMGMGGRLGENIREQKGMAYYIYSEIQAEEGPGPWAAAAGVNPSDVDRAVEALLHEIDNFISAGPTAEELADAQAYLTGSLALGLETSDGIAGTLLSIERNQLGLDYIERYPSIINAITREAIIDAARAYLSTERYVLVSAGAPAAPPETEEETL